MLPLLCCCCPVVVVVVVVVADYGCCSVVVVVAAAALFHALSCDHGIGGIRRPALRDGAYVPQRRVGGRGKVSATTQHAPLCTLAS